MGACYSNKAGGRKYTYTTVQMASSKLEDSSRLARPTPYSRSSLTSFSARKGIPVAKSDRPLNSVQSNVFPNVKSSGPLSNIPRFNPSVPTLKQEVNENFICSSRMKNENSSLNVVNNNAVAGSQTSNGLVGTVMKISKSPTVYEGNKSRISSSKISSDSINKQIRTGEKPTNVKSIPKFTLHGLNSQRSLLPHVISKTDNIYSPGSLESNSDQKNISNGCSAAITKFDNKKRDSSCSEFQVELGSSKSSYVQSDSHDSITDLDSGLGSSLTERYKQDDVDTLKDVDKLECCEINLPIHSTALEKKPSENSSVIKLSDRPVVKCPTYKRSLNGKWVRVDNPSEWQKSYSSIKPVCQTTSPSDKSLISIPSSEKFVYKKPFSQQLLMTRSNTSFPQKVIESHASPKPNVIGISAYRTSPENKSVSSVAQNELHKSASIEDHSVESDDKSLGSETKSPTSEIENRDFLIDDEISDQPNLISVSHAKNSENGPSPSLQQSVTELYALSSAVKSSDQLKSRDRLGSDHRDSLLLGSELGSSCSSIASDDMMLDYEKRNEFPEGTVNEGLASPLRKLSDIDVIDDQLSELGFEKTKPQENEEKTRKRLNRRFSGPSVIGAFGKEEWRSRSVSCPLRPPRPMSVSEAEDGSVVLDSSSYRLLSQDLNGVKTLLLRLKGVIQEAETISPFDQTSIKSYFYPSLVYNDVPQILSTDEECTGKSDTLDNADLCRKLLLLQQQVEEKNHTIHLLQQQMTKYANMCVDAENTMFSNAATQTEMSNFSVCSVSPVDDGSIETLVSAQDACEEHGETNLQTPNNFHDMVEVSRSLNSLCQDFSPSKFFSRNRSLSSTEL